MEDSQVRPLASAADRPSPNTDAEDTSAAFRLKRTRHRRCIKCCGCVTAFLLILIIVIVILIFTVFKEKDPTITMNGITITNLDFSINALPQPRLNMTLVADVSVKNPNAVSFKFNNATTIIYYRGVEAAEARNPPGTAKARRTLRMNVTADVMADQLSSSTTSLLTDLVGRQLPMSTSTIISGKVKILFVKKHVGINMNCSMTVNITSMAVDDLNCKRKIKL